jgi:hypothetical protein
VEGENGGFGVEGSDRIRVPDRGQEGSEGSRVPLAKRSYGGQVLGMLEAVKVFRAEQAGAETVEEALSFSIDGGWGVDWMLMKERAPMEANWTVPGEISCTVVPGRRDRTATTRGC